MKLAARVQICQDLYTQGLLCKCEDWHEAAGDEGQEYMTLHHEEGCTAREQFIKLMNLPDEESKS